MNLREYLFYTHTSISDIAALLDLKPNYMRAIVCQSADLSPKLARRIETLTKGVVTADNVRGPPSHPLAKKILDDKNKIIDINNKPAEAK